MEADWTVGGAVRFEHFEDFGATTNGKISARYAFVRASVSSGFRAPTPGQQNGFNISTIFDPALGDLVNNGVIPSISPVAALRGGVPLEPERSVNYTAGVVFDTGPFNFSADYFRIDVSDRIGITSNFALRDDEIASLLAQGIDSARDLRNFRFFTNAFDTASQGIDVVSTYTPIALRGNTVFSAVFNFTDTEVTDNEKGLLNDRRIAEYAYALPRVRWNAGVTQRVGRVQLLGRVSYFGGWYDWGQRLQPGVPAAGRHRAGASSTGGRSSTWRRASISTTARRWRSAPRTCSTPIPRKARARCRSARSTASTRPGASTARTTTPASAMPGAASSPWQELPSTASGRRPGSSAPGRCPPRARA